MGVSICGTKMVNGTRVSPLGAAGETDHRGIRGGMHKAAHWQKLVAKRQVWKRRCSQGCAPGADRRGETDRLPAATRLAIQCEFRRARLPRRSAGRSEFSAAALKPLPEGFGFRHR